MEAPAIEIEGLRKEYRRLRGGRTVAVDGLNLTVPQGGVFGFLGPNGAGKTTTIRSLLGLIRLTAGRCRILGTDVGRDLPRVIDEIGALVEGPGLVPGLTGRRNLEVLAVARRVAPRRVDQVLDQVGLTERAKDPVRTYSMGMRQRLGVAVALLKDPRLLILDEPSNGLDPAGIKEIRALLRQLGSEGRTVFLSSHLLAEVEQICDQVAIITAGRCLTQGPVGDVLAYRGTQGIVIKLRDGASGMAVLTAAGIPVTVAGETLRVGLPPAESERVMKTLVDAGLIPYELRPEDVTLETVFLRLTGEEET